MTDFRVLLYKIKNGLKKRVRQVLEVYDLDFEIKDKYDIDDLLEVTRILRSETGRTAVRGTESRIISRSG